ncbi:MAG: AraC family transcriptional regulator [Bacteroidales bacterium]|nr:AraC family transcriptional regulator [Bacteroidales bacterium]
MFLYSSRSDTFSTVATYVTSRSPRRMVVLNRFFDLVEKYFATERQISFYADKLCLAPKYASQVIRQASGKMAGDWIQERVILEAKLLLLDGHHNVQQVADALNFSSQSFFGKYFKSATGMSPKEYVVKNR